MSVIRKPLSGGKYRYETGLGDVVTAKSGRVYTHASVYVMASGKQAIFLHGRRDLAIKGSSDANRICSVGGVEPGPGRRSDRGGERRVTPSGTRVGSITGEITVPVLRRKAA